MRSTAQIKSHPIHPMLIPFPIAFLVGGFGFNAAGLFLDGSALWLIGGWLVAAGVATGLVAAVPGLIDYFFTVPPNSSAKHRATRHGLATFGAVALFAIAWLLRGGPAEPPTTTTLAIQAAGAVLLAVGGWLGGTLVSRNMISVDHRHARAGRWRERRLSPGDDSGTVTVAAGELEVDQMELLHVDGRRIVLARTAEGYVAFDDRCSHRGGSLADGVLMCGRVQCLWHGSQFDVTSGAVLAGPAESPIRTYDVKVDGDEVRVALE